MNLQVCLNQNEIFKEHKWLEAKVLQLGSNTFVTSEHVRRRIAIEFK